MTVVSPTTLKRDYLATNPIYTKRPPNGSLHNSKYRTQDSSSSLPLASLSPRHRVSLSPSSQNSPTSPTRNRSIPRNPSVHTSINSVDMASAWP